MIGIRLSAAVRVHYLRHLFGQSIHVLDSLAPGHAVSTITSTSNVLQIGISEKLGVFVEYSALIVSALVVAFTFNWELALVTSAGIMAVVLCVGILFPLTVKGQARQARSETEAAAIASEAFGGIRMIMASGAEQHTAEKYGALVDETKRHARSTSPITSFQFAITVSFNFLSIETQAPTNCCSFSVSLVPLVSLSGMAVGPLPRADWTMLE